MAEKKQITQKALDAMIENAIDDLKKSGEENRKIYDIVEKMFGLKYSRNLFKDE